VTLVLLHHRHHVVEYVGVPEWEKRTVCPCGDILSTYIPSRIGFSRVLMALRSGRAQGDSAQQSVTVLRT
jgi:hypothetical protein